VGAQSVKNNSDLIPTFVMIGTLHVMAGLVPAIYAFEPARY